LVILSHWDADHWSSAPLVSGALNLTFVAPYQVMTPPQITFAGTITGSLMISKATPGTILKFANVELHRANGPISNRNDSGFFMVVQAPSSGDPFFFPGDADYSATGGMPATAAGMLATHHGGNWKSGVSPPAAATGKQRVVYSFGSGNSYKHPTAASRSTHASASFSGLDTVLRPGGLSGNGTGHVYLDWSGASIPSAPCGNPDCYQNLDQS
jgi:beta-lactamase superfamily II metal-dependent hydrolase